MISDDTIVAVSTPSGTAARAIVRLSGPQALKLAGGVFVMPAGTLETVGGFRWTDGLVKLEQAGMELPARAYVFRSPLSYTRQDVVELHIPGAVAAAEAALAALIDAGARHAQAGEFTARAFFSGRLDLSAAQAVADIIDADDDASLRSALAALKGQVAKLARDAADRLTDALAAVEASIDLADQDIGVESPAILAKRLDLIAADLRQTVRSAPDMPADCRRPQAALAGAPNVGKSSLLNALSGVDRAIVSALAGTTRDVLSATMTLDGATVTLHDAAGLSRADEPLSKAAADAAREAVAQADAVLFVVDMSASQSPDDAELLATIRQANSQAPLLVLANKADAVEPHRRARRLAEIQAALGQAAIPTSALTGDGLADLRRMLADCLCLHAARGGGAMGLPARGKRRLLAAADAAARASALLAQVDDIADRAELAAIELRGALAELAAISPNSCEVLSENVLARIFERFCVGK